MTSPIVRAERAIGGADGYMLGTVGPQHMKFVTAALGAIRSPSDAMVAAGAKKVRGGSPSDCAAAVWRAMHDAMMRE